MKSARLLLGLLAGLIVLAAGPPALAQKVVSQPGTVVNQTALAYGAVGETAQSVTDGNGLPVFDAATVAELQGLRDDLATPADTQPPEAPVASTTTTLTSLYQSISASGDTTLVSGTASTTIRIHALYCSILPTSGTVTVSFKSGTTVLRAEDRPSTGGMIEWRYRPYWHLKTATAEDFKINFSGGGAYKCVVDYVKGA